MITDYYGLDRYEIKGGVNLSLGILGYLAEINMSYLTEEEQEQYKHLDFIMAYEGVADTTDKNNPSMQLTVSTYSEKLDLDIKESKLIMSDMKFYVGVDTFLYMEGEPNLAHYTATDFEGCEYILLQDLSVSIDSYTQTSMEEIL